jgi:hypothetical protein
MACHPGCGRHCSGRHRPLPSTVPIFDSRDCTCYRVWQSVTPPPPCPVHSAYMYRYDYRTSTTTNPGPVTC